MSIPRDAVSLLRQLSIRNDRWYDVDRCGWCGETGSDMIGIDHMTLMMHPVCLEEMREERNCCYGDIEIRGTTAYFVDREDKVFRCRSCGAKAMGHGRWFCEACNKARQKESYIK